MPSGRLSAVLTTTANTTSLYTVPATKVACFTINVLNSSDVQSMISFIALAANSSAPNIAEYIEKDVVLGPGESIERTGVVLDADKSVVINTGAPMSVLIYGYED